jgi:hypothetical protein
MLSRNPPFGRASSLISEVVLFVALLATALALGAALAHALELPNKMGLPRDEYFIVQKIYAGWDRLAVLLVIELAAMVAAAVLMRSQPTVFWFVIVAILCLLAAQGLFWTLTFPANAATENWTVVPADWEALRRQWEYSHLGGAAFQLMAFSALLVVVMLRGRPSGPGSR